MTTESFVIGDSIRDELQAVRTGLNLIAQMTATKVDDRIVQVLDMVLDNQPLIDFIDSILNGGRSEAEAIAAYAVADVPQGAEAISFGSGGFAKLIKYLPQIIALIKTFRDIAGK